MIAFKKCGNIDMCLSIAYRLQFSKDNVLILLQELIDILVSSQRFKEAGDLQC